MRIPTRLLLLAPLAALACGDDGPADPPTLRTGSYSLVANDLGTALPVVVASTTNGETVLSGGSLFVPQLSGGTEEGGVIQVSVSTGPLGGPYQPSATATNPFAAELQGSRLLLKYVGGGVDTLVVRSSTTLVGRVRVPSAAAGMRMGVTFRIASAE